MCPGWQGSIWFWLGARLCPVWGRPGLIWLLPPPDLLIYLRCPVQTLKERIRLRGRVMEKDIPTLYLKRLNALYEEWFSHYKLSPVLVLPTDKLDYLTNLVDRVDLFRQIEKHL